MEFQEDGTPCSMKVDAEQSEIPRIFRVDTGKGTTEVIVHLSVAECMMRRGILGMKLVPVDIRF